jgi:hypothetical protein
MGEPDDPLFEIVMATRFNATTFAEFQTHLARRRPAFYNTPCPITRTRVPSSPNVVLYVLEMHNDANVLMGVGLVRNEPTISPPPVYRDRRYNFYGYPIERRLAFRAADERGRPAADLDPRLDGPQRELIASLEATPTFAWLQIMLTTCMMESGYFLFEAQTTDAAPGDIGGDAWVRYDDPEAKTFKLNVERQNGRAAMLGVFGCILHELVGVDALYPTGGLGNGAPPTIF